LLYILILIFRLITCSQSLLHSYSIVLKMAEVLELADMASGAAEDETAAASAPKSTPLESQSANEPGNSSASGTNEEQEPDAQGSRNSGNPGSENQDAGDQNSGPSESNTPEDEGEEDDDDGSTQVDENASEPHTPLEDVYPQYADWADEDDAEGTNNPDGEEEGANGTRGNQAGSEEEQGDGQDENTGSGEAGEADLGDDPGNVPTAAPGQSGQDEDWGTDTETIAPGRGAPQDPPAPKTGWQKAKPYVYGAMGVGATAGLATAIGVTSSKSSPGSGSGDNDGSDGDTGGDSEDESGG
jgi:hypothetical protein